MVLAATLFALGPAGAAAQQLPAGHVPVQASRNQTTVVVLETMTGGGYTYVRGAMNGEEAWFAGPGTALAVGDTVLVADPMPMQNFSSSSLNRTFDVLYFVGSYGKGAAPVTAPRGTSFGTEGEVLEVLSGGGYTYVRVDNEGESLWMAGPPTKVEEGDIVSWRDGSMMRDFSSRTLGRTFEEILFVQEIAVVR
jgi:hypothetical protein